MPRILTARPTASRFVTAPRRGGSVRVSATTKGRSAEQEKFTFAGGGYKGVCDVDTVKQAQKVRVFTGTKP